MTWVVGCIPTEIGHMTALEGVWLETNMLTGACTWLRWLSGLSAVWINYLLREWIRKVISMLTCAVQDPSRLRSAT